MAGRDAMRLLLVSVDRFERRLQAGFEHVEPDQRTVSPDRTRTPSITVMPPIGRNVTANGKTTMRRNR